MICKTLLLNIPLNKVSSYDGIQSIDDIEETIERMEAMEFEIPPETEFWAHCSNLQTWAEQDYDSRLLQSNLAFPLLKRLTEVGDSKAAKIFKFEILKRFIEGNEYTREFLTEAEYIDYFGEEEFRSALSFNELYTLEKLERDLQVSFTFAKYLENITGIEGIERDNLYFYDKLEDTHITGLRIYKFELKKIPKIIADFKELKYLVLSYNHSEYLPESIGSLNKLEFLDLSTNKLKIIPESYKKLSSLKFLDLYSNEFKEIPKILEKINSLETVLLGGNQIKNFLDKIGNLKKKNEDFIR
ncbi:hypothetical protein LCGC14_2150650, partial [marine sediment metagenome]